jgi:hypothetical protein
MRKFALLPLVASAFVLGTGGLGGCGGSDSGGGPVAAVTVPDAGPTLTALAEQIDVTEIAVLQVVKASIWRDGAKIALPNAPVVAGRPSVLRVYVKPRAGWKSRGLVGKLRVVAPDAPGATGAAAKELFSQDVLRVVGKGSIETDFGSTFTYALPPEALVVGARYSLSIVEEKPGGSLEGSTITWPADGSLDDLGVKGGNDSLKVKIVPVRYDADGSGRVASTTPEQLKLYRDTLYQLYPTASVEVTVRDPMPWANAIDADGTGWDEFLTAMWELRAGDAPADDVYYAGAFVAAPSFMQYCRGGCVLGLAGLAGPKEIEKRALAMVGFDGDDAAGTLAHELGHTMGRAHAPCGNPAGIDKKYPYDDAIIGSWGWNVIAEELLDPTSAHDVMGYCKPLWVSDYTYSGLYARMASVNAAARLAPAPAPSGAMAYRALHVGKDGALKRGRALSMHLEAGPTVNAEIERADGARVIMQVPWIVTDGPNGGFALVPEGESIHAIRLRHLDGRAIGVLARTK